MKKQRDASSGGEKMRTEKSANSSKCFATCNRGNGPRSGNRRADAVSCFPRRRFPLQTHSIKEQNLTMATMADQIAYTVIQQDGRSRKLRVVPSAFVSRRS